MHAMRKSMAKGFTLVEILIVVVILGILAAIVVPQFTNAANEARMGNVYTQTSTLENQLELYAAQHNGAYPTVTELNTNATGASSGGWGVMIDQSYIKEAPANPFSATAADSVTVTAATMASAAAADTAAAAGTPSSGWLYDQATGFIRASSATY